MTKPVRHSFSKKATFAFAQQLTSKLESEHARPQLLSLCVCHMSFQCLSLVLQRCESYREQYNRLLDCKNIKNINKKVKICYFLLTPDKNFEFCFSP